MSDEWFYAQDGESVGPMPAAEVARRIDRARGEAHLVWAPGMPGWVDGRSLPQFAPKAAAGSTPLRASASANVQDDGPRQGISREPVRKPWRQTLLARARHEVIAYLAVSGYLLVWFTALLFYKSTILHSAGIEFTPFTIAVVKALILGKFILALEAVKLGERRGRDATLIAQIGIRAFLFTVALVVLSIVEDVVMGHFHGRSLQETLGEIGGGSLAQLFAAALLMFLVLVPYLAFRRLAQEIGELPELLFTRRGLGKRSGEAQAG